MHSNDIYEKVTEKIIELSSNGHIKIAGIPVMVAFQSKVDQAEFYRRALYDYSIEKLEDTEENKIVVEDLSFLFARFENQFASQAEKDSFYNNYVCSILGSYNELTEKKRTWRRVDINESGEYPSIDDDFVTRTDMDNKDAAIWLFKKYEKELERQKQESAKGKKEKAHQKTKFKKNPFSF